MYVLLICKYIYTRAYLAKSPTVMSTKRDMSSDESERKWRAAPVAGSVSQWLLTQLRSDLPDEQCAKMPRLTIAGEHSKQTAARNEVELQAWLLVAQCYSRQAQDAEVCISDMTCPLHPPSTKHVYSGHSHSHLFEGFRPLCN